MRWGLLGLSAVEMIIDPPRGGRTAVASRFTRDTMGWRSDILDERRHLEETNDRATSGTVG